MTKELLKLCKELRALGWNYQHAEWLLASFEQVPEWRFSVEQHLLDGTELGEYAEVTAQRVTLAAAIKAVHKHCTSSQKTVVR